MNVISIASRQPVDAAEVVDEGGPLINYEAVEALEELLAQARSGCIQSIAYAAIRSDTGIETGWSANGIFNMLAAVTVLNGRINTHVQTTLSS